MNQQLMPPASSNIKSADWLNKGYVISLRLGGGFHLVETKPGNPLERAQRILSAVQDVARHPDSTAIFLTKEDCAIVTEYFPDVLVRNQTPPVLGRTITL